MWKKIGSLCLVLSVATSMWADNSVLINTSVDKQSVAMNESLTLTLSVDGNQSIPRFTLPPIPDFTVVGQSSSTEIQIINGQQSMTKSTVFTLKPLHQGTAHIPVFQFNYQGRLYHTQSIDIQVTKPAAPSSVAPARRSIFDDFFNDDFFNGRMFQRATSQRAFPAQTVIVDNAPQKNNLYVGEKTFLNFTLSFERAFQQGPALSFPEIPGLITGNKPRELKDLNVQTLQKNGKAFTVMSYSMPIYAASPGTKMIPPLQVQYVDNPFDGVKTIASSPHTVHVQPLPTPQPDGFSGAVGQFRLQADLKTRGIMKTHSGIPVVFTLTGEGNADMVNTLQFTQNPNAAWYLDSLKNTGTQGLSVMKEFHYVLTLSQSGKVKSPEIQFSYFDPSRKTYQTATAVLPELTVEQSSANSSTAGIPQLSGKSIVLEPGTVEIRLNKKLLFNIGEAGIKIMIILVGILGIVGMILLIRKIRSAPLMRLRKRLLRLRRQPNLTRSQIATEIYAIADALTEWQYHLKLTGATNATIQQAITDASRAQRVMDLVSEYEMLNYAKPNEAEIDVQSLFVILETLLNE